jgi:hypothetical protein
LDFSLLEDCKLSTLSREFFQKKIGADVDLNKCLKSFVNTLASCSRFDWNIMDQGLRVFVENFDFPGDSSIQTALTTTAVTEYFLRRLLLKLVQNHSKRNFLITGLKVIGLLALNEQNRSKLPTLGALDFIIGSIKRNEDDAELLQNSLWSLVVLARPLGSFEGSPFVYSGQDNIQNVTRIIERGGIQLILSLIQRHTSNPSVISKAFWCLVNLALVDSSKSAIANHPNGLRLIINLMQRYPEEQELLHRGCFLLINLSLATGNIKDRIRDLGGIQVILDCLLRHPSNPNISRCACNVLISLCWQSDLNRSIAREYGALGILRNIPSTRATQEMLETAVALINE